MKSIGAIDMNDLSQDFYKITNANLVEIEFKYILIFE